MTAVSRYRTLEDLPDTIPVFPLDRVLLLPRAQLPLNIFEPRYLAMIDDSLSGSRIVGMVQPDDVQPGGSGGKALARTGTAGRITAYTETPDNRYLVTLTGIARFETGQETTRHTPYRTCRVSYAPFAGDLTPNLGEEAVDRERLVTMLRSYLDAQQIQADWDDVNASSTESLVNALSILSPYGAGEKQALLEAPDLRTRAELLIALTEMELGHDGPALQ